jgi:hypothetical protein
MIVGMCGIEPPAIGEFHNVMIKHIAQWVALLVLGKVYALGHQHSNLSYQTITNLV